MYHHKIHTDYNNCSTKCLIHGDHIYDVNCFLMIIMKIIIHWETRFWKFDYCENYQTTKAILINIFYFGTATNTTLDYIHLVCLKRKLLSLWIRRTLNTCVSNLNIQLQKNKEIYSMIFLRKQDH